MPRPKKKKEEVVKTTEEKQHEEKENANNKYIKLVSVIKKSKDQDKIDEAFEEIMKMIMPKIRNVVSSYKYKIAGYDASDILQEALFALRFKAIKDYDITRGNLRTVPHLLPFSLYYVFVDIFLQKEKLPIKTRKLLLIDLYL